MSTTSDLGMVERVVVERKKDHYSPGEKKDKGKWKSQVLWSLFELKD